MSSYPIPLSTPGYGTLECSRHYPEKPGVGPGWITVDHADPRIKISHELLDLIQRGGCQPYARLVKTCICYPEELRRMCPHYQGARLEIAASNRRLVYIIGELDPTSWCWTAEWPD